MKQSDNLLYFRRQFLLTNRVVPELNNWQHRKIGDMHLFAHPDLEITAKEVSAKQFLLLGYIFDPFNPEKKNSDIIEEIFLAAHGYDDLFALMKPYTGRYALIFRNKSQCIILHDPYGNREIYYIAQSNSVICGSQPNLIREYSDPKVGLSCNQDLLNFYNHDMKPVRLGRMWVGEETVFQNVKHLRPNHYLDINSLTAKRYWPNTRIIKMDLHEAARLSCAYLRGALKAVTNRYKTMMAVTAGFDSRSLLAASREVREKVYYFINKEPPLTDKSPDIWIPKAIFKKLGIPFHVHKVDGPVDEKFKELFLSNTFWALDHLLPTVYNVYFNAHQDKVNILGRGELGRVYYGEAPHELDGYYLARSLTYKSSYYATLQCERWLQDAKKITQKNDIDIMKLFLWEELIGNWGVVCNSESDIAIEEFDPYSSHYIGELLMSLDPSQGNFFKAMYKEMWPELLEFPINPAVRPADWVKNWLARIGLFLPLRRQLYRFDRWRFRKQWSMPSSQLQ